MTDERIRRIGQNEALYRQVNEKVRGINEGVATMMGTFDILCECGTLECMEHISVTPQVYEQTRADPHRFIVLPGHQIDDIEAVVSEHGNYIVLEKLPPEAREIAEEMDPRSS
jgi:hypothetical protein